MKPLEIFKLETIDKLLYPDNLSDLTLDSSALHILTDFERHKPLVLEADTSLIVAEQLMRKAHVRLKLIIDADGRLVGLLSAAQVFGELPIQIISEGTLKSDITVSQLMQPRKSLSCLDFHQLSNASIGEVVNILQAEGIQHCLVVDHREHHIRGVVSAGDIARRLHIDVPITQKATSFIDIFNALNHH